MNPETERRLPRFLLMLLLLLAAVQTAHYYPLLPETVASHFGGRGEPNAWSSKQFFFGLYWMMLALLGFLPTGASKILTAMPISLVNLPNKEYWLAPERRSGTLADFKYRISLFSVVTTALIMVAIQLALRTNLATDRRFSTTPMWVVLISYAAFVVTWLSQSFRNYSQKP